MSESKLTAEQMMGENLSEQEISVPKDFSQV